MITDESIGSPAAARNAPEAPISVARLALDDAETPGKPTALADGCAHAAQGHVPTCDDTDPSGTTANGASDQHAIQHLNALFADKLTGQNSNAQSGVIFCTGSQFSASATSNHMLGSAVPSARMETTGMMASIAAPQGRHVRYDADSDSEGRLAQPCSSRAAAEPAQSCSQLNSIDHRALLSAVADTPTPACKDSSGFMVSEGGAVSDAVIQEAMQGVLASTVDAPADLQQGTQASSILAGIPDAPHNRQTLSRAASTLHSASSPAHAAAAHHSHTASHEDSHAPATPDPLAGSHSVDPAENIQAQQHDCCTILEASASLTTAQYESNALVYL